jgi:MFS family permease
MLSLLSVGMLVAFFDRSSIASVLANDGFIGHFSLSAVERGWIGAAFFWGYALSQIPMGWIVDRYGVKIPYAIFFGLWCLATAAAGAVTAFSGLIVMRLIVGLSEGVVIPANYRWIRLNVPERHAGAAIGILLMGNKIGTAIGAPVAAWLIVSWCLASIAHRQSERARAGRGARGRHRHGRWTHDSWPDPW